VHGEEYDLRLATFLPQLGDGFESIQLRHGDVGDNDVRDQSFGRFHEFPTILDNSDEFVLEAEDAAKSFHHDAMVVR